MPNIKLTQSTVDALPLKADRSANRTIFYWCKNMPGFGVRVNPVTGYKSYICQGILPDGKTPRITIGRADLFSLQDARLKARTLLADMAMGIDPTAVQASQQAAQQSASFTLRMAMADYFERNRQVSEATGNGYEAIVNRFAPDWLDMPLANLTTHQFEDRYISIPKTVVASHTKKGWAVLPNTGYASANLFMRTVRAMYNWASDRKLAVLPPGNPAKLHPKVRFEQVRRDTVIPNHALSQFYQALPELDNLVGADYLRFVLHTGMRRQEAAMLTWAEVDLDNGVITLAPNRTKAKRKLELPITPSVKKILEQRYIWRNPNSPAVFPANSSSGHICEPRFYLNKVCEIADLPHYTIHDLRRTYITIAESCDIPHYALKALVNHSLDGSDVTAGYIKIDVDRLRAPANDVDKKIEALVA